MSLYTKQGRRWLFTGDLAESVALVRVDLEVGPTAFAALATDEGITSRATDSSCTELEKICFCPQVFSPVTSMIM
jgi:hypothetical protein